jgi:hypothetical protein
VQLSAGTWRGRRGAAIKAVANHPGADPAAGLLVGAALFAFAYRRSLTGERQSD